MKHFVSATCFLLFCLLPFSPVSAQTVDDLILMTENFPPYNFEENGRLQGVFVDVMVLMLERLDSRLTRKEIRLLPWASAYNKALTRKNTVLFSMIRTEKREALFKWVGPLWRSRAVLIARKDRHLGIASPEELKKYRIGVIREDVSEELLAKEGVGKDALERVPKKLTLVRMLNRRRIDLWGCEENGAKWVLKKNGFRPEDYETLYVLKKTEPYYAFHKDVPGSLIRSFQNALDEIKEKNKGGGESGYEHILNRYLK